VDTQLKLQYINSKAVQRYKNADELIGQSILSCHKEDSSKKKIAKILEEFAGGRREPYNYSVKKDSQVQHKVILPYYDDGVLQGLIEFMYISDNENG
jgi:hypothetical protein